MVQDAKREVLSKFYCTRMFMQNVSAHSFSKQNFHDD